MQSLVTEDVIFRSSQCHEKPSARSLGFQGHGLKFKVNVLHTVMRGMQFRRH